VGDSPVSAPGRSPVLDGRAGHPGDSELAISGLFIFIGARPRTGWLAGQLAEDSRGFLLTGTDIPASGLGGVTTTPLFLETSRPDACPSNIPM
jgi:hypothetical protein